MSAPLSLSFLEGKIIRGTSTPWRLLFQADKTGGGLGDAWALQNQPVVDESQTTGGEQGAGGWVVVEKLWEEVMGAQLTCQRMRANTFC